MLPNAFRGLVDHTLSYLGKSATYARNQTPHISLLTGQHHLTAMSAYLHHAARSRDILSSAAAAVNMPVQSFLLPGKAYVASRDLDEADHFIWLQNFAPDLKFESVLPESWPLLLQRQDAWAIRSLLLFPNDGMVSPVFFESCVRALEVAEGSARSERNCNNLAGDRELLPSRSRLVEVLLEEGRGGGCRVQGVVVMRPNGREQVVKVDHLIMSLGPGASLKIHPPLLKERLAELRLAGLTAAGVAMMMPSLVVRQLLNQVHSILLPCHNNATSIVVVIMMIIIITATTAIIIIVTFMSIITPPSQAQSLLRDGHHVINETFWAAGASVVLLVAVENCDDSSSSSNSLHSSLLSNWEVSGGIACVCIDYRHITTSGELILTLHLFAFNFIQLYFWIASK
jgi:hypothetical protein